MTIAVLSGGSSLEREVSLRSGKRVTEALRGRGHTVVELDLDEHLLEHLTDHDVDLVFLALHGKAGEDGSIQSLLDLVGVPYTGSGATASALAWDKSVSKGVLRHAGVHTPDWHVLSEDAVREYGAGRALRQLATRLSFPIVVKPLQGGSSLGVGLVEGPDELAPAVMSAFNYHPAALLERYVPGTEVAVSIVDGAALPAVEIHAKAGAYDFGARYTHGATEFHAPARLAPEVAEACATAAQRTWELLGCRHVMRADLIVDSDGVPWLIEADTCPGLTETSLLPIAAKAGGLAFEAFCERVIDLARTASLAA
ncbi:MAG TPA: D-alanine--D-alanine ligase [Euzebyales bacterium]|nr:D-alanine--D-alanine ligase [Euzebyales bacterium]